MSNEAPTDALRLPDRFVQLATDAAWARNVNKATAMMVDLDDLYALLLAAKAAPASPLPGGGDILWMMHVRGPDDIYPAPDFETAVAWCDYVNDVLAKAVPEVVTKAVPAIWTGSPESHADGLPDAIKGWTLPAAPTGEPK